MEEEYGSEQVRRLRKDRQRASYVVLRPEQMDDDAVMDRLDRTPAFNRDKRVAEEIKGLSTKAPEPVAPADTRRHSGPTVIDFSAEA